MNESWVKNTMSDNSLESNENANTKPFDPNELAKLIGDDLATLVEFSTNYRQSVIDFNERIQQALKESDNDSLTTLAHSLKSSSRAMGAFGLADCCQQLETLKKTSDSPVPLELLENLDKHIESVINAIDQYLAETESSI